jgi:hypothetical protein
MTDYDVEKRKALNETRTILDSFAFIPRFVAGAIRLITKML